MFCGLPFLFVRSTFCSGRTAMEVANDKHGRSVKPKTCSIPLSSGGGEAVRQAGSNWEASQRIKVAIA